MKKLLLLLTLSLAFMACNKTEKAEPEQDQSQATQEMPQDANHGMGQSGGTGVHFEGNTFHAANFKMTVPDNWSIQQPKGSMRLVQFAPKSDSTIEIVGFYFGNQENMVQANIDRWKGQFVSVENFAEETVNDKINFVKISGTFKQSSAPMDMSSSFTEAPGYLMLAAIVPSKEGPYFFKAVGPKDVMEKELDNFKKFLQSYNAE